jgi:hypothetical protein
MRHIEQTDIMTPDGYAPQAGARSMLLIKLSHDEDPGRRWGEFR